MEREILETRFFFVLLVGAFVLLFFVLLPYLATLAVAAALAIVLAPLRRFFMRHGVPDSWVASLLVVLLLLTVVFIPLVLMGIKVLEEASGLSSFLSASGEKAVELPFLDGGGSTWISVGDVRTFFSPEKFRAYASSLAQRAARWVVEHMGTLFSSVAEIVFKFFLGIVALYFFLKDGEPLGRMLAHSIPLPSDFAETIIRKIVLTVNSVIKGSLVVAVVQGTLAGVGFVIFGVPGAAFWGATTILAALVPAVGTLVTTIPAVLYLVIIGKNAAAFGLALWGLFIVGLIDNVLRPLLIKRGVHIHPLLIFLSVLGGLQFFGPAGFLLGPLVLSVFFALLELYPRSLANNRGKAT